MLISGVNFEIFALYILTNELFHHWIVMLSRFLLLWKGLWKQKSIFYLNIYLWNIFVPYLSLIIMTIHFKHKHIYVLVFYSTMQLHPIVKFEVSCQERIYGIKIRSIKLNLCKYLTKTPDQKMRNFFIIPENLCFCLVLNLWLKKNIYRYMWSGSPKIPANLFSKYVVLQFKNRSSEILQF